jgi:hypothetical protein
VAAWVADMFYYFYLVKNHKIANNSTNTEAREKIRTDLAFLEFYNSLICVGPNLKQYNFHFIKLATDFYYQPSYLLGERDSSTK